MKTEKKKILIIDNAYDFTGAFKSIFAIREQLQFKFHFIFCLPAKSSLNKSLSESGVDFITLPFVEIAKSISVLLYFPMLILNTIRLSAIISAQNISIIHVNDLYNMTGVAVKILKPRVKLIYHIRLMPDSYGKLLYPVWVKLILRFSDHVVCNSFAVRKGLMTNSPKVRVIYNAPPVWHEKSTIETSNDSQITLLYLANFVPGKGHDYAIEALAGVVNEIPANTRMIMSGGSFGKKSNEAFKQSLKEKAKRLQIDSHIVFTDFEPDVQKAMRNATIFLNFSESESFSMTCLEALSFGVPVIATDCGGPADLIENGRSGLLVKNRDIEEMKQAILRLCKDSSLRNTFSKNGLEFVKSKFVLSEIIKEYLSLYEN